ncbi:hypothetical protein HQN86_02500 [Pedobacter panaciterrae]|jgi:hypothetical protein|uniref:hypothetical protein n=1 Tax=Pedobacter panaciterrae TaxID=363849 RepID=UPI00155DB855|nr:hypothetical protein [Pedobacter panaciterrae]NQX52474.1 hypothetical protein [Pedobacter panaciterrae]
MKKTSPILILLLLVCCVNANAQFGKLKDALNTAAGSILNNKQLKLLQSDPITTNFDDCNKTETMPVDFGADSVKKKLCDLTSSYTSAQGFTLKPGFYTGTFKSFCLKAGTHGPGNGDGYLYAPLAGPKETIARTLISNWEQHPEIEQSKVQLLLWAIIAKTNFSKLSPDLQLVAAKLLNKNDLSALSSSIMDYLSSEAMLKITANLPEPAKTIVEIENKMRGLLYQANSSYDQIEQLAMLSGSAAPNTDFPRGIWGLHPDGYYIKYLPHSYTRTEVVIYVPKTIATVNYLPVGMVAVPASRGCQRLGQSNLLACEN